MAVAPIVERWADFAGVHRRFEHQGDANGVHVYDDYAHHPTEIAAVLTAARAVVGDGRLIAVFQPGTYSRTQTFAAEFAQALELADIAVVLDIFPAREEPIPGISGATITELMTLPAERVIYEPSFGAVAGRIAAVARPGDVVVTMGIGNVYLLCAEILEPDRGRHAVTTTASVTMTAAASVRHPAPAPPRKLRSWSPRPVAVRAGRGLGRRVQPGARRADGDGHRHAYADRGAGAHGGRDRSRRAVDPPRHGGRPRRVEELPDVASATVRVSYPSTVRIKVVERVPVGYIANADAARSSWSTGRARSTARWRPPRPGCRGSRCPAGADAQADRPRGVGRRCGAERAGAGPAHPDQRRYPAGDHAGAARRAHGGLGERATAARRRPRCCRRCSGNREPTIDVSNPGVVVVR